MVLSVKCVAPVRVNGTNEMDAKPFSAEVLCTGRRDGEVVCCCERRSPSRSASATIAGSAARLWSRARLESRQTGPIRVCLVWAAQAKVKAAAQRETTPGAIRHTHDLLSSPSTESLDVTTQCEQGGARSPGYQSCRVEIGSRAYSSALLGC